ncbi:PREDICTED: CMRF35-like molecule 6 [Condylura cristata]|uniref:CMRF35-like molecule 6 n=1 Tax=Condylura cristata TaxID=143302 RepID=UPI00033479D6|nr:PREDICTED: CMRF35-like molecule 6 [Condylura cristata]
MEALRLDDADTYWCGIDRVGADLGDEVKVTVAPASTAMSTTSTLMAPVTPGEGQGPPTVTNSSSLLGSVHFRLLVFLKVPLFLSMLSAVLWELSSMVEDKRPDSETSWAVEDGPGLPCFEQPTPQMEIKKRVNLSLEEMARRDGVTGQLLALLLLQIPGCWCLDGPRVVTGSVGGSLRVQCRYQDKYKDQVKYWCKVSGWVQCEKIVKASRSQRAGRSGRVSIRDYPANLTFTVTLERLTEADAGTYKCGIDVSFSSDPVRQVEVSVSPGLEVAVGACVSALVALTVTVAVIQSTPTRTTGTWWESLRPDPHPGSLLGSVHFRLLVFLKVPLFLSMLSAVLWVSRPQRDPGGRQSQPDYETH